MQYSLIITHVSNVCRNVTRFFFNSFGKYLRNVQPKDEGERGRGGWLVERGNASQLCCCKQASKQSKQASKQASRQLPGRPTVPAALAATANHHHMGRCISSAAQRDDHRTHQCCRGLVTEGVGGWRRGGAMGGRHVSCEAIVVLSRPVISNSFPIKSLFIFN